jgi:hypothetical protein
MFETPLSVSNSCQPPSTMVYLERGVQDLATGNFKNILRAVLKGGYICYAPWISGPYETAVVYAIGWNQAASSCGSVTHKMHALTAFMEACLEGDVVQINSSHRRQSVLAQIEEEVWHDHFPIVQHVAPHLGAQGHWVGSQQSTVHLIAKRHVVQAFQLENVRLTRAVECVAAYKRGEAE